MEAVDMLAQVSAGGRGAPEGNDNAAKTNVDNMHICFDQDRPTGNSTAATMRRLAKDFPQIHAEVWQ